MLRIHNIKLNIRSNELDLIKRTAKILRIKEEDIKKFKIIKKSIDARNKEDIFYVYSVELETDNEKKYGNIKNVQIVSKTPYSILTPQKKLNKRPVIVGSGPCGLFAALVLSENGHRPIIIERGKSVSERKKDVDEFFQRGILNVNSNVQFGEGGAGTFSDGKLTTGINDVRIHFVLEQLVKYGANEEILYNSKPHIGTDKLIIIMENIRKHIVSLGGEYRFSSLVSNIIYENSCLKAVEIEDIEKKHSYVIDTENLILAIGHSARDTFEMLYEKGILMTQKAFSVGVRIEHSQKMINVSQYGKFAKWLPSADYKLNTHLENKRGAYTFCMCPGGVVVASASEKNMVVTNGMSYAKRDLENANSALLVNVSEKDFNSSHPLAGIAFQRELEQNAFAAGGGDYKAPCQMVGDFMQDKNTTAFGNIKPTYLPGVSAGNLNEWLPDFLKEGLKLAIIDMDKRLKGFNTYDAVLTAIESRSSSPVRIFRDEKLCSNIKGLYPAGEGAGYAGGIMSAAVDGMRCAETLIESVN